MTGLSNLDKINVEVRGLVEGYIKRLIDVYGEKIKSVSLYGSVTLKDFNYKKSDINVLVIMDSIGFNDLKSYSVYFNKFSKKINPLVFTKQYMHSSQDVYPIEFLEMKDRYINIYGEDILSIIGIDRKYLRLECEQQLKGALIKLRQGVLQNGAKTKVLEVLIENSINTIITIFKGLIRIKSEEPPAEKTQVIYRVADMYGINKDIFDSIYKYKLGYTRISSGEIEKSFEKYLIELEMLINKVDNL